MNTTAHEVVKFPTKKKINKAKVKFVSPKVSSTYRRKERQWQVVGGVMALVALTVTGLSLSHLAHGIQIVTHAPTWEAWAMAIGVDLSFIVVEVALLVADDKMLADIKNYANTLIVGTMLGSAILNAFAFGALAEGWMIGPAVTLGLAIPGMLYALTKIIAKLLGARG